MPSDSQRDDLANLPLSDSSSDSSEESDDDRTKMVPGKSHGGENVEEDVEVKAKLLHGPKTSSVSGEPSHSHETSVTMEYTDTD